MNIPNPSEEPNGVHPEDELEYEEEYIIDDNSLILVLIPHIYLVKIMKIVMIMMDMFMDNLLHYQTKILRNGF